MFFLKMIQDTQKAEYQAKEQQTIIAEERDIAKSDLFKVEEAKKVAETENEALKQEIVELQKFIDDQTKATTTLSHNYKQLLENRLKDQAEYVTQLMALQTEQAKLLAILADREQPDKLRTEFDTLKALVADLVQQKKNDSTP